MEKGRFVSALAEAGSRSVLALAAGLLAAAATSAQEAAWERVDVGVDTIWQDPDWSRAIPSRFSRNPSRLAADNQGRVYLANGPDLLIGAGLGKSWVKVEGNSATSLSSSYPVAAAGAGLVFWRGGFSRNGGANWDSSRPFAASLTLLEDGTRFIGNASLHITGLPLPLLNARMPGDRNAIPTIQADGRILILPSPHP